MRERILQLVLDSFRDQFYVKALDCVKTLREEAMKVRIPQGYQHCYPDVTLVKLLSSMSVNTKNNNYLLECANIRFMIFLGWRIRNVKHISPRIEREDN